MFAYLVHPNFPNEILHFWGPLAIRWYGLMYALGFVFAYTFILYLVKKKIININEDFVNDLLFITILGVIIGGRLGYVLFYNLP